MKRTFTLMACCLGLSAAQGQTYLSENFDFGSNDSLTANGWVGNTGGTTNALRASAAGLIYTGYVNSGTGNSVNVAATGQDAFRESATAVNSGSVYVSFLANFSDVSTGDYFLALLPTNSTSNYVARVFAQEAGTGRFRVGITKAATTPGAYSSDTFYLDTTYLFVVKYQFNASSTNNDSVKLYVFSSGVPATEPALATAYPTVAGTDAPNIARVNIRQGSPSSSPTLRIDGVRMATTWDDGPLPVRFISTSVQKTGSTNLITWSTASENNNSHFEIERSDVDEQFRSIGTVRGRGNSSVVNSYSFTDARPYRGASLYRIRQVDFDGMSSLSPTLIFANRPAFEISAGNPFGKDLNVSVNSPVPVSIRLFDVMGRVQFEGVVSGSRVIDVSALPAGIYFLRSSAEGEIQTQRVVKN
jgi:hypothetical protein